MMRKGWSFLKVLAVFGIAVFVALGALVLWGINFISHFGR